MARQLQFFTRTEIAGMRDRTAARNYSPEAEAFRRPHERHRAWGLKRRHATKERRLRESGGIPRPRAEAVSPARVRSAAEVPGVADQPASVAPNRRRPLDPIDAGRHEPRSAAPSAPRTG